MLSDREDKKTLAATLPTPRIIYQSPTRKATKKARLPMIQDGRLDEFDPDSDSTLPSGGVVVEVVVVVVVVVVGGGVGGSIPSQSGGFFQQHLSPSSQQHGISSLEQ